jgi:hypothetical protein
MMSEETALRLLGILGVLVLVMAGLTISSHFFKRGGSRHHHHREAGELLLHRARPPLSCRRAGLSLAQTSLGAAQGLRGAGSPFGPLLRSFPIGVVS